ncbi:MAG: DUF1997 domain-containing protein [Leptolyngbyaceae cyanobacterium bins.59]|nr:DUF1997 domain-containing protein [Leptolyngbyaceae cyanobacterium bins.59]
MQLQSTEHSQEAPEAFFIMSGGADEQLSSAVDSAEKLEPVTFSSHYVDHMELYADTATVAQYFDVHHLWFRRCAHPMQADLIGENAYGLTIGRYGAFGYEVEPQIGLNLLPQKEGVYRIETVPIPNQTFQGYEVDFKASMELIEVPVDVVMQNNWVRDGLIPPKMTRIQWDLQLEVMVQFPRFIYALPKNLIRNTGDRLLAQIIRQVSRKLTLKVQDDFHSTVGVSLPKGNRRK